MMHLTSPNLTHRWAPALVAIIGVVWAAYYVIETRLASADDPDTYLFIKVLIWPLCAAAIAVVVSAFRRTTDNPISVGLGDRRRLLLVGSLPVFGVAVVYGGFLIPSVLYVSLMTWLFGVKSPLMIAALVTCIVAIVWGGFFYLLSVPLQLWPPSFQVLPT